MTSKKNVTAAEDTNPVEDPCADLRAEVETLRAELDAARAELETNRIEVSTGRAGFMVTTPNPKYNGQTAGVQFRNGRAFIPQGDGAIVLANTLENEFGYKVEYVTDWQAAPGGGEIAKTFIDSLVIPDRR